MLKDYQRSNEVVFAEEAIWISEHSSIENMASAVVIAETFEKAEPPGNLLIPKGRYLWPFARMLGAVWTGGYIAGVREQKAKFRRGMEFVSEEITAQKSADRWRKKRLAVLLSKMDAPLLCMEIIYRVPRDFALSCYKITKLVIIRCLFGLVIGWVSYYCRFYVECTKSRAELYLSLSKKSAFGQTFLRRYGRMVMGDEKCWNAEK